MALVSARTSERVDTAARLWPKNLNANTACPKSPRSAAARGARGAQSEHSQSRRSHRPPALSTWRCRGSLPCGTRRRRSADPISGSGYNASLLHVEIQTSKHANVSTYAHNYIHPSIHTYTYIYTHIHTVHTYIHPSIHPSIHYTGISVLSINS
jgi:hypothetical protein